MEIITLTESSQRTGRGEYVYVLFISATFAREQVFKRDLCSKIKLCIAAARISFPLKTIVT